MSREPLLPGPAARRGTVLYTTKTIRDQDNLLSDLSRGVKQTKTVATAIHNEVNSQDQLLDDLGNAVSSSGADMNRRTDVTRQVTQSEDAYTVKTFCLLLWPLVLLIVLVVEAIIHFIF